MFISICPTTLLGRVIMVVPILKISIQLSLRAMVRYIMILIRILILILIIITTKQTHIKRMVIAMMEIIIRMLILTPTST